MKTSLYRKLSVLFLLLITVSILTAQTPKPKQPELAAGPDGLSARENVLRKHIILKWNAKDDVFYAVYRKETGKRQTSDIKLGTVKGNQYIDKDIKDGKVYGYSVMFVGPDGTESAPSYVEVGTAPQMKITTTFPDPRKPNILVKWTMPRIHEPLNYNLYRAVNKRNRFKKIAEKKLNDTTYLDTKAVLGANIYYKIKISSDTSTFERDFSNVKSIPFTYKGLYVGFDFKPSRSRVKNEFWDKDKLAKKGNNTYASLSLDADYYFLDRVGVRSGIGFNTISRTSIEDGDPTYSMKYIDIPIQVISPIIRPVNFQNRMIIHPIIAAGVDFSFLLSEEHNNFEWTGNYKPFNIALVGSIGVDFYLSRNLIFSFGRFYSHGLTDVGGGIIFPHPLHPEDPDKNVESEGTRLITRGVNIAMYYKIF